MGRLKQTLKEASGVKYSQAEAKKKTTTTRELTTINIKIPKTTKQWLSQKAQQVRDNNTSPVPPNERVYPQHLINVAIEMLEKSDVDWSQVSNIDELREKLNL